jgi:polyphosphate kinase 2 (PPK2 family)
MSERLQNFIKLNELAENIFDTGRRVAVVLEGRDGAGKSGTVREITRYMPPYAYRVQPSFMPSKRMMKSWLPEWKKLLPQKGQMVIYDRSWYSRALLQPVMGWCSDRQYKNFMRDVTDWEHEQQFEVVKVWLSVNEKKQRQLLSRRVDDPLRYWKYSPNDPKSLDAFDAITQKKNAMFELNFDWNVIDMESRDHGRNRVIENIISQL